MSSPSTPPKLTIGVLALQGAFAEHLTLLRRAAGSISGSYSPGSRSPTFEFLEVRTPADLSKCLALIIPGGESTTMALVAERSGLTEVLRSFIKIDRKPVWGTCAGLILLSEAADVSSTKRGGQELLGGLDVLVRRNHFGRQANSFVKPLHLAMLASNEPGAESKPFSGIFIRAPVVERVLAPTRRGETQVGEEGVGKVVAPQRGKGWVGEVEVLGQLGSEADGKGEIVAVRQGNVFGTSFHPELTDDERVHVWWLGEVIRLLGERSEGEE